MVLTGCPFGTQFVLALCFLSLASAAVVPLPYSYGVLPYHVPFSAGVVPYAVPVVHPGYVAKTPGATHIAPLPEGLAYASHHINAAPAPGTK